MSLRFEVQLLYNVKALDIFWAPLERKKERKKEGKKLKYFIKMYVK